MEQFLRYTLFNLFLLVSGQVLAQPATQIYLAKIKVKATSTKVGIAQKVSTFAGYNNQPSFSPNGKVLYYTANRGGKQTDIFAYEVKSGKTKQMINTSTSEYSPMVTPDGKHFSCIMVEADGTQRLWKYPLVGGNPSLVLKTIKPVGYHVWVDNDALVLFVLGDQNKPHTLQLASAKTETAKVLDKEIGRCFGKVPGKSKHVSFVHKPKNASWTIKQLDTRTQKITNLTSTLQGSEDYVWTNKGGLIMGQGARLYVWQKGTQWKEIADLSSVGIKKITRLAINPKNNLLAIVGQ